MGSDETQMGLRLSGLLRPPGGTRNQSPQAGATPVRRPTASTGNAGANSTPTVPPANIPTPPVPARNQSARSIPESPAAMADLRELSAVAAGHGHRRSSRRQSGIQWMIGFGILGIIVGLIFCGIYWQQISQALVGTSPSKTIKMAIAPKIPKVVSVVLPRVASVKISIPPALGKSVRVVSPRKAAPVRAAKPASAPVPRNSPKAASTPLARLDLDHPFFQTIKGPLPPLFHLSIAK